MSERNELGLQIRVSAGLRSEVLTGGAFLSSSLMATAAADKRRAAAAARPLDGFQMSLLLGAPRHRAKAWE